MNVSKLMHTTLTLARPEMTFNNLLCAFTNPGPRQLYVVDEEYHLLGIITSYDIIKMIVPTYLTADLARSLTIEPDFIIKRLEKIGNTPAKEIMITQFATLRLNSQLAEADTLILEKGCNALPVIDERGRLRGELTRADLIAPFASHCLSVGHTEPDRIDLTILE